MNQAPSFVPLSAFSPLTFTFRILERDFVGVAGPLFVAALIGQLQWIVLGIGVLDNVAAALILAVVWIPIGSWCTAGMLRFSLRIARGQAYGYRDLWLVDASVLRLILLELVGYAAIAASFLVLFIVLPRETEPAGALEDDWFSSVPSLAPELGTAGGVAVSIALAVCWLVALTRTVVAPVLIVDERVGVFRALVRSVTLTRGNSGAIFLYGIIIGLIGGLSGTMFGGAALAALSAPGIVYVGLAVRGELVYSVLTV